MSLQILKLKILLTHENGKSNLYVRISKIATDSQRYILRTGVENKQEKELHFGFLV